MPLSRSHAVKIHGTARRAGRSVEGVRLHACDLQDLGSIVRCLEAVGAVDAIFHLASNADVRGSWEMPASIISNNVAATTNLLEAIRLGGRRPLLMVCSTSEVYGQVAPERVPITEEAPINPANPYAVSKVAQDLLARVYHQAFAIPTVTTRAFGYINPRRGNLFATAFARQVARVERGLQRAVAHGNLDSVRTLLDVRDVASAYWTALLAGRRPGPSAKSVPIAQPARIT